MYSSPISLARLAGGVDHREQRPRRLRRAERGAVASAAASAAAPSASLRTCVRVRADRLAAAGRRAVRLLAAGRAAGAPARPGGCRPPRPARDRADSASWLLVSACHPSCLCFRSMFGFIGTSSLAVPTARGPADFRGLMSVRLGPWAISLRLLSACLGGELACDLRATGSQPLPARRTGTTVRDVPACAARRAGPPPRGWTPARCAAARPRRAARPPSAGPAQAPCSQVAGCA